MYCSPWLGACLFVRWEGGENFTELAVPQIESNEQCILYSYGENGSYAAERLSMVQVGNDLQGISKKIVFEG